MHCFTSSKISSSQRQRKEEALFQLKKARETRQLNMMGEPGLHPGLGGAIAIKDFVGSIDVVI